MSSVLVVEDDSIVRELLLELFYEEHSCHAAENAERALALLDSVRFDVVLTDISMPGMSGLELLGHVRQRWPETTVIMISGIRDQEYAKGLVKMGAFDYLVKPFDLAEVKRSVARALGQYQPAEMDQSAQAAGPIAQSANEEQPGEVFSAIQLDKVFSLCELVEMVQRSRMSGYIQLRWNDATIEEARRTGRFQDAAGTFDQAIRYCSGRLYLHEGLLIDAAISEREASPYWRDPEQALALLVRLATWVEVGVRAWGFTEPCQPRTVRLSVADNSGKLLSIITGDEGAEDDTAFALVGAESARELIGADAAPRVPIPDIAEVPLYKYWSKEDGSGT
ncbi:MAG: response regulator [Pyrinomonadaceae bacterium]